MKNAALLAAASLLFAAGAFAQSATPALPPPGIHDPGTTAVAPPASTDHSSDRALDLKPQALPASPGSTAAPADASLPQIRVREKDGNRVQEYSRNGRVYMVVVTPPTGIAQTFMVDPQGRLVDEHGQKPARPVMYKVLEWGKSKPATDESTPPDDGGR